MSDPIKGRCGNCMEPYHLHRQRMEAAPICMTGGTVYREATEEELEAGYRQAFPDGLKPVATFRLDDPASLERVRQVLGAEALNRFFGPGGGGMPASSRCSVSSSSATISAKRRMMAPSVGFTERSRLSMQTTNAHKLQPIAEVCSL